ncbi:hypothetical protein EYF80_014590 [Liparis tanakae]|uniref:Secreted protein n=1 Tax=Liparis tanakae TaxID=230148 RepID=A0A4Z2IBA8_9TELE|nr:hypothetical protein EYF80_014590 [Liparis tanakae]
MPSLWMWTCSSWIMWGSPLDTARSRKTDPRVGELTLSLLLSNDALALPVQELQVVRYHPLLAFVDDFGVGAGVKKWPFEDLLIKLKHRKRAWPV